MDDYRNWPPVEDPTHIDEITQEQITTGLELLLWKGVYPYEWMNDDEKLYTTSLPPKECFPSELYKTFLMKNMIMLVKYGTIVNVQRLKNTIIYI